MKYIAPIFLFVFLVSCASDSGKDSHPNITNESFKKKKQIKYNKKNDNYKDLNSKDSIVLSSETAYRMEEDIKEDLVDDGDIPAKIINNCYLKKFTTAYSIASKNHDSYKTNPVYWNQIGSCFLLEKKYRKALLYYNKALEFNSSYTPVLNNIAVMYRLKGEDQKALVMLNRAVRSDSNAKTPSFNVAQLLLRYALYKKAETQFLKLNRIKPNDIEVLNGIAVSKLFQGKYQDALSYYKKIDDDYWERPYIGINVAFAQFKLGMKEDARNTLEDINNKKLGQYSWYYSQLKKKLGVIK